MSAILPPTTIDELLTRAYAIAGLSIADLATHLKQPMPTNLSRHKGWLGQLLEIALGATAGSQATPDFENLGVELKTIPVDSDARARESTYVCTAPLLQLQQSHWQTSWVCRKLSCVLWIPIVTSKETCLADRQIGMPFLWRPTTEQAAQLQQDWQELTDMICLGQVEEIAAHHGDILQIRPKAANGRALCWGINAAGEKFLTLPRGFYLRAHFTTALLQAHYVCA